MTEGYLRRTRPTRATRLGCYIKLPNQMGWIATTTIELLVGQDVGPLLSLAVAAAIVAAATPNLRHQAPSTSRSISLI